MTLSTLYCHIHIYLSYIHPSILFLTLFRLSSLTCCYCRSHTMTFVLSYPNKLYLCYPDDIVLVVDLSILLLHILHIRIAMYHQDPLLLSLTHSIIPSSYTAQYNNTLFPYSDYSQTPPPSPPHPIPLYLCRLLPTICSKKPTRNV